MLHCHPRSYDTYVFLTACAFASRTNVCLAADSCGKCPLEANLIDAHSNITFFFLQDVVKTRIQMYDTVYLMSAQSQC